MASLPILKNWLQASHKDRFWVHFPILLTRPLLFEIARGFGIGMHMYADDTQIYEAFHPDQTLSAIENLEQCITAIRHWMTQNHLKLNESKTEVLAIGNPAVLKTCNIKSVKVGTECVNLTDAARNTGAVLDSRLCMEDHVLSVTKSCYHQLYRIGQIRPYLSEKATAMLCPVTYTLKARLCKQFVVWHI